MEVQSTLLVGFEIGLNVGGGPKDTTSIVVMERQQICPSIIWLQSEQCSHNSVESDLELLDSCYRIVGDAGKVMAVGEVEVDIHKILFICRFAAIPQVEVLSKVIEFGRIFEQAFPQ